MLDLVHYSGLEIGFISPTALGAIPRQAPRRPLASSKIGELLRGVCECPATILTLPLEILYSGGQVSNLELISSEILHRTRNLTYMWILDQHKPWKWRHTFELARPIWTKGTRTSFQYSQRQHLATCNRPAYFPGENAHQTHSVQELLFTCQKSRSRIDISCNLTTALFTAVFTNLT
jgi:hypothetical protein